MSIWTSGDGNGLVEMGCGTVIFSHDAVPNLQWRAIRVGPTWNGFLTPVVQRSVAVSVLRALEEPFTVKADESIVGKDFAIAPNGQGEYDLAPLGFTFHAVDKPAEGLQATYEHHFVTCDQDAEGNSLRFSMIEDEVGGMFWGYGHVSADVFVAEVNRWMLHIGLDRTELPNPSTTPVDHLWAYCTGDDFKLVDGQSPAETKDHFPVTRLWI